MVHINSMVNKLISSSVFNKDRSSLMISEVDNDRDLAIFQFILKYEQFQKCAKSVSKSLSKSLLYIITVLMKLYFFNFIDMIKGFNKIFKILI